MPEFDIRGIGGEHLHRNGEPLRVFLQRLLLAVHQLQQAAEVFVLERELAQALWIAGEHPRRFPGQIQSNPPERQRHLRISHPAHKPSPSRSGMRRGDRPPIPAAPPPTRARPGRPTVPRRSSPYRGKAGPGAVARWLNLSASQDSTVRRPSVPSTTQWTTGSRREPGPRIPGPAECRQAGGCTPPGRIWGPCNLISACLVAASTSCRTGNSTRYSSRSSRLCVNRRHNVACCGAERPGWFSRPITQLRPAVPAAVALK